jgi:TolB-like protein/DNA-binding winged helix-turn-helix (wHTH) protein
VADRSYHFGEFELDRDRFELRRNGRALKLERIPLELLLLLAEKQGAVVTRQEIIDRLWGKDVFVDTEHGINTAIRKIRQALRDDPDDPRFVQTVTGKGYRFVAEKTDVSSLAAPTPAESAPAATAPIPPAEPVATPPAVPLAAPKHRFQSAAALLLILVAGTLVAVNAAGLRDRLFPATRARQIHSIAVIPLTNLSGDPSQDYFADGMTDEVITMLAKNTSLRVVSRTSAMQYKGVKRPLPDIARELGVDGILEGSIERSAKRVHMTVQLIYAPTDAHVWAESYDRDLDQAFSLPLDLSQTIAKAVQVATSPARPPRYISPEAHDAYLHGRYFWFTFNVSNTLPYFEKAIQLQPDYAAAWSGLADTYPSTAWRIGRHPKSAKKLTPPPSKPSNSTLRLPKPIVPWPLGISSTPGTRPAPRPRLAAPPSSIPTTPKATIFSLTFLRSSTATPRPRSRPGVPSNSIPSCILGN